MLAVSFRQLIDLKPNFSIEATGFLSGEIDIKLDSLRFGASDSGKDSDLADRIPGILSATVSRPGDVWDCALHRVMCESCLNEDAMRILMKQKKAHMVLQDGPYNVSIARHASGLGTVKHKEFKMASGEMSREQFSTFLGEQLRINASQCLKGAVVMSFMDWRSIDLLIKAGRDNGLEFINMCVWVKSNGSMGSLYRSQHELICVFRLPGAPSTNNVQLGKFGRHRTNVWTAPGSNSFSKDRMKDLEAHPTPKNVALLADAIRDVSNSGEIVLDSFLGSGTTMIAAERTERVCYGMELDPAFVDVAVRRWEEYSGSEARLEATGQTFAQVAAERAGSLA